jgi:hypothetical protein
MYEPLNPRFATIEQIEAELSRLRQTISEQREALRQIMREQREAMR